MKEDLVRLLDRESDRIVEFISKWVSIASPTPPGDTVEAMAHVERLLDEEGIAYDIRCKDDTMPNLVASRKFGDGDKHLALNGHIDVFPVADPEKWSVPPWSGKIVDGKIYGRGVADMKVGTAASIFTYIYLHRLRDDLKGKLTLTVVSDEERLGPNGANFLFDEFADEITGTSCLNGEPSSRHTVRFGEKGAAWVRFTVQSTGGHGAYHNGDNAVDLAFALIKDLRQFTSFSFKEDPELVAALEASAEAFDLANGKGATKLARSILMNVGNIKGGASVNMIPSHCQFEVDFRLPNGVTVEDLVGFIDEVKSRRRFDYEVFHTAQPNWCEPDGELSRIVRQNARQVTGIEPASVIGMGNNDSRLWRYRNVPAVVYGPSPATMASVDEHVTIEEALNVVRVHALSAYDYLAR